MAFVQLGKLKEYHAVLVAPHPDDIEFGCAGLCLYLVGKGLKVLGITVTDGRRGMEPRPGKKEMPYTEAKLAKVRKKEQERSARILGYDVLWLGLSSLDKKNQALAVKKIREAVKKARPAFLVIPGPDTHPTHQKTYRVCRKALGSCKAKQVLAYPVWTQYRNAQPVTFKTHDLQLKLSPKALEIKKKALASHASQMRRPEIKGLLKAMTTEGRLATEQYARQRR